MKILLKSIPIFISFLCLNNYIHAQTASFSRPSWRFGIAAGANLNTFRGSTQTLDFGQSTPTAFHDGHGVGLFLAPQVEYHPINSMLGVMFQAGYDRRNGSFDQIPVVQPCNCPADLSTNLSYITLEPSLRFAPFKSGFYLYTGPRIAFSLDKAFTYNQGTNFEKPEQATLELKGDFSQVNSTLVSMQIGAGYDIYITGKNRASQVMISPFVAYHPNWGQSPRSIDTWEVSTLRLGIAMKFGLGKPIPPPPVTVLALVPQARFSVNSPRNLPTERRVREIFPMSNYVFFDLGSTEIPDRYILLPKNEVQDFKAGQLLGLKHKNLSGRSKRQMEAYYNVLNILGDRMDKNPTATIRLVGASEKGPKDGKAMAASVKRYLVDIFGIQASRIETEGKSSPKSLSDKAVSADDRKLWNEGKRRVSIESHSPAMLMEFQSGPGATLKAVEIEDLQKAPIDSYVSFKVEGAKTAFSSWSLQLTDEAGVVQDFGPYTREKVLLSGQSILGTRKEGNYIVNMLGQLKDGTTETHTTPPLHVVSWTPTKSEQGMRYSVLFELNESRTISLYEKYLREIVLPKIPIGATVIIQGYTDVIGEEDYNQKLSWERAEAVMKILENAATKINRKDIHFEAYGFGEDQILSPFDNKYPEERFYNRTVVIDIFPAD